MRPMGMRPMVMPGSDAEWISDMIGTVTNPEPIQRGNRDPALMGLPETGTPRDATVSE